MRRIIGLLVLVLSPLAQAIEYREELAPPDVDFYLELQGTRTDFGNVGGGERDGMRLRLGMDLKDATLGRWMLRAEVGINQFGETRKTSTRSEAPTPGVDPPSVSEIIVEETNEIRLSGIETGVRLYNNELLYLRGGVFIYSFKRRVEEDRTPVDINGDPVTPTTSLTPAEETSSGIGPYIGAGLEIPLVKSVKAIAEFNAYGVEDEILNNLSLGLRFQF